MEASPTSAASPKEKQWPHRVIKRPGIPVTFPGTTLSSTAHWKKWWYAGVALLAAVCFLGFNSLHSVKVLSLTGSTNLSLDMHLQGCDVFFAQVDDGYDQIRVSYWTWLTSATVGFTQQDGSSVAQVNTTSSSVWKSFKCHIHVQTSKVQIVNVNLAVDPDAATILSILPTNTKGLVGAQFAKGFTAQQLTVKSNVYFDMNFLAGARFVEKIDVALSSGGMMSCSLPQAPKIMKVTGDRVVFSLVTQEDLHVVLDETIKDYAVVSAATVVQVPNGFTLQATSGGSGKQAGISTLSISGTNIGSYLESNNGDVPVHVLQTHRGVHQTGKGLMPSAKEALVSLKEWLHSPAPNTPSRYMIYLQFVAPHAPLGTLRLLSAKAYVAFSLSFFALISAGMMNPTVVWMQLEITGFEKCWPRGPGAWLDDTLEAHKEYSLDLWELTNQVLTQDDLLSTSVVLWKPASKEKFGSLLLQKAHSISAGSSYIARPLKFSDTSQFILASCLTLVLGLTVGFSLCWLFYAFILPDVLKSIRKAAMTNNASYNLTCVVESSPWSVNPSMIQYPSVGVLLRWKEPAQQCLISTIDIKARTWPLTPDDVKSRVKDVDVLRLPMFPGVPGQQCFLFSSRPAGKLHDEVFNDMFDNQLYACARTFAPAPKLKAGAAYQFRIEAYQGIGDAKTDLCKSTWTRPSFIAHQRAFSDYPLLMIKTSIGMGPADTWAYFLQKHTLITSANLLEMKFTNIRLAIRTDSALVLKDIIPFGETLEKEIALNVADRSLSLENKKVICAVDFESQVFEFEELETVWTKTDKSPPTGLLNKQYRICKDTKRVNAGALKIGYTGDAEETVQKEVSSIVIRNGLETEADPCGSCEVSWEDLFQACVTGNPMVLRDGTQAVGLILADATFENPQMSNLKQEEFVCEKRNLVDKADASYHGSCMLEGLVPGFTYIWGETLGVTWDRKSWPCKPLKKLWTGWAKGKASFNFDVYLCAAAVHAHHHKDGEAVGVDRQKIATAKLAPGGPPHLTLMMSHQLPQDVNRARCHLELVYSSDDANGVKEGAKPPTQDEDKIWYRSPQFCIVRPVSMQDLEIGYASWCVQNQVGMTKMNNSHLQALGLTVQRMVLKIVPNYRQALPWEVVDSSARNALINFDGCTLVHDQDYLLVDEKPIQDNIFKKIQKAEGPPKPKREEQGLGEPLLQHDSDDEEEQVAATRRISTKSVEMFMPVNCFWRYHSVSWHKELLLYYGLQPNFATPFGLTGLLTTPGHAVTWFCDVMYVFLCLLVFFLQGFALVFPAVLTIIFWVLHDIIRGNVTSGLQEHVYEEDIIVSPSLAHWSALDSGGQMVMIFFLVYTFLILGAIFYCNFLSSATSNSKVRKHIDRMASTLTSTMIFCFITYMGILGVWCFMGAIVDPEVMLPYAIMMLMLYFIVKSNHDRLTGMVELVMTSVHEHIDKVLHVLTSVFLDAAGLTPPGVENQINMAAANLTQATLIGMEKDFDEKLAAECKDILTSVEQGALATAEFRVRTPGKPEPILATDFVSLAEDYSNLRTAVACKSLLESSQSAATKEHLMSQDDPLKFTETGVMIKPPIELGNIYEGISENALDHVKDVGAATDTQNDQLKDIAGKLQLNLGTATQMRDAFFHAIASADVQPPVITAGDLYSIRFKQLFSHFTVPEGAKTTQVKRYLQEVQEVDMETFDGIAARKMSEVVDWEAIGITANSFIVGTIWPQVLMRVILQELDPTDRTASVFKSTMKIFDVAAGPNKVREYIKKDEARVFLDAGIVDEAHFKLESCRSILNLAIDSCRDPISGSLAPSAIVKAARSLIIPSASSGEADVFTKHYLWYDAFLAILDGLGWEGDELRAEWLKKHWDKLTNYTGLFGYQRLTDIVLMVQELTHSHLWRTAVKAIVFKCKVFGMIGCDVATVKGLVLSNNPADFKTIQAKVRWPDWVEEIYQELSEPLKKNGNGPRFLDAMQVTRFMKKMVYDEDEEEEEAPTDFTPMLGLPTNVTDMQWKFGGDPKAEVVYQQEAGKIKPKKIRGLWFEVLMAIFEGIPSIPSDADFYFEATKFQQEDSKEKTDNPRVQFHYVKRWLNEVFMVKCDDLTNMQFHTIINDKLGLGLPDEQLDLVFQACPEVDGDDRGELRRIEDLGLGLKIWMGMGLWKRGCRCLVETLMQPGGMRDLAMAELDAQFDVLDEASGNARGVIQIHEIYYLVKKICHVGLTSDELHDWIQGELGMEIPKADMQQCFNVVDTNGDGVLSWDEFVPALRFLLTNYIPRVVLEHMGLTTRKILTFVLVVGLNLGAAYLFISLVFVAFTTGEGIASAMHSSMATGMGAYQHVQSKSGDDSGGGAAASVASFLEFIGTKVRDTIVISLGLSKTVADRLAKELETAVEGDPAAAPAAAPAEGAAQAAP